MVRKTKEEAMATRDLILDTAECVFQKRGVAATSLQEIAQTAGLTRGAIYWHFDNKADVFDAMMQRVALPLESVLEAGGALEASDPLGFLLRAMDDLLFKLVHDAQVRRVFEIATLKVEYVGDLEILRTSRIKSRDACTSDLERVLALASSQGQIPPDVQPHLAARGLFALMDGILYNWLLDPQAFDLQQSGHRLLVVYLRGLAMQEGEGPMAMPAARPAE
jgi:TetR/AcrR family acrAB operon transcriptional repressor